MIKLLTSLLKIAAEKEVEQAQKKNLKALNAVELAKAKLNKTQGRVSRAVTMHIATKVMD